MSHSDQDPCPTPAARKQAPFSPRAAAVFLVGLSFLVMVVSGLAVTVAPAGRLARELDWSLLGLGRTQWELLHLSMGLLFIGAGVWHIWLHWPVIRNLLWSAAARTLCHRRELALAVGLVGGVIVLAILWWPPVSWLDSLAAWFRTGGR
ncbi:MAG: DUF4405 domain-containing protein [Rhodobacteraceae bacterium]|nr:MAG: DUF4405 domain-containing protein [Paracoccaceae bacterium]